MEGSRTASRQRSRYRFLKIAQRPKFLSDAATQNRNRRRLRPAVRDPSIRSRCSLRQDDTTAGGERFLAGADAVRLGRETEVEAGQQTDVVQQVGDADGGVVGALGQVSLRAALADRDQLNEAIEYLVVAQGRLGFRRGSTSMRVGAREVVHQRAQYS